MPHEICPISNSKLVEFIPNFTAAHAITYTYGMFWLHKLFIDKEKTIEWKHKEITRKTALRIAVLQIRHNKLLFIKFTQVLWQASRPKFWLYFGKMIIYAQELKSIFCLYMIDILMHYPETPSTRQQIARSTFTDDAVKPPGYISWY